MGQNDSKYLIALHYFPKFGSARMKRMKQGFPSWQEAFNADLKEMVKAGIEENIAAEFVATRSEINPEVITAKMEQEKIDYLTIEEKEYPPLLKETYDPPYILYYRGQLSGNDQFAIAVVGTRKFTAYGRQVTEAISEDLARQGLTIVSGLALGVDALAHESALKAKGRTIAVLGTGLDRASLYPPTNKYLAEMIIANGGLIISEFPIGTPPLRQNFPQRNRIISGLSRGTLVVEAGERSGALITARFALEQNREVFAVPGSIYSPYSYGPNYLIKQGAKPVSSAADIIEALDLVNITNYIDNKKFIPDSPEEEIIIGQLSKEPKHVDEIIRLSKLNAAKVNSTLVMMEMKGIIKNLGGMEYVLAR